MTVRGITKEILLDLYVNQRMSASEIGRKLSCGETSVFRWLEQYGITRRTGPRTDYNGEYDLTKENLIHHYVELGKTTIEIAQEVGCNHSQVSRRLHWFGITLRPKSESTLKAIQNGKLTLNWSGCGDLSGKHWTRICRQAEERGLAFEVTIEQAWALFVRQDRKCALSGVEISFRTPFVACSSDETTASLDRIDSSLGYVMNNVQWVHKTVQKMKWDADETNFVDWCSKIVNNVRRKQSVA